MRGGAIGRARGLVEAAGPVAEAAERVRGEQRPERVARLARGVNLLPRAGPRADDARAVRVVPRALARVGEHLERVPDRAEAPGCVGLPRVLVGVAQQRLPLVRVPHLCVAAARSCA